MWGIKPTTNVDLSITSLNCAIADYVGAHQTNPIGVVYSPMGHYFVLDSLQKSTPYRLIWHPIPGFPPGAFVLFGDKGTWWSPGA